MGLFNKSQSKAVQLSERQLLENKYSSARGNILLVVVLTVINIVLLVTNSNTYFLFSAYIPFILVDFGKLLCGMYPAEYYTDNFAEMEILPKEVFAVTLGIAIVILVLYVLCWIFSKKFKIGWLITALVFFSVDTLAMLLLNGFVMDSLIDYVIHVWVIFSFANGLVAYRKFKKLPEESAEQAETLVVNGQPVVGEEQPIE